MIKERSIFARKIFTPGPRMWSRRDSRRSTWSPSEWLQWSSASSPPSSSSSWPSSAVGWRSRGEEATRTPRSTSIRTLPGEERKSESLREFSRVLLFFPFVFKLGEVTAKEINSVASRVSQSANWIKFHKLGHIYCNVSRSWERGQ